MSRQPLIMAIDQGTTSSRAIVFDEHANIVSLQQQEFAQLYPQPAWVEHNPEDIWQSTLQVAKKALQEAESNGGRVEAIGITNQRETTLVWDRGSGRAIHNAIVWQDRRTAKVCDELKSKSLEATIQAATGLLLDPYFSATKIAWLLDNVDNARDKARDGKLAFGTVDSFLLWRLSGGLAHKTDATNASRTSLYNIHRGEWDRELLDIFDVPEAILPSVENCAHMFAKTEKSLFGREIPICAIAGDQQAAAIGQCCFDRGDTKSTYGTGCFVLMNTGTRAMASQNKLLTTVAYQLDGERHYALEGAIFVAGASIQWLRDELKMINSADESEAIAKSVNGNNGVYLVPAFTGLGAPHWDSNARGALVGLTRDANKSHIVRAALESVCYQTYDLMTAISADAGEPNYLRVDGGMATNRWLMQFLADILGTRVDKPVVTETTAQGVAFLAGLHCGIYKNLNDIRNIWQLSEQFQPSLDGEKRDELIAGWTSAVKRVIS